jgi:hypothetical protein
MDNDVNRISQIIGQLENLNRRHEIFVKEIQALRAELIRLKDASKPNIPAQPVLPPENVTNGDRKQQQETIPNHSMTSPASISEPEPQGSAFSKAYRDHSGFEKFVGENLINKIGIVIVVIGVSLGTKYAITN